MELVLGWWPFVQMGTSSLKNLWAGTEKKICIFLVQFRPRSVGIERSNAADLNSLWDTPWYPWWNLYVSVKNFLQYGTSSTFTDTSHDRTSLTREIGESQLRWMADRSTGIMAEYVSPSLGIFGMSSTCLATVLRYVHWQVSPQSVQKVMYSVLPTWQRLPEYPDESLLEYRN